VIFLALAACQGDDLEAGRHLDTPFQEQSEMPRKKTAAAALVDPSATPAEPFFHAVCPACKSKITYSQRDGATLHEKSKFLEDLVETDTGVDEVEKNIGALEKKLGERDATIADLRTKLEEKSKPAAPAPQKETANVGQQKSKSWWD
jgi:hypothetical protein